MSGWLSLLDTPPNHHQINLPSGPIPTQQEVSSTRVVSWSQRLSPGLKWTANRDAGRHGSLSPTLGHRAITAGILTFLACNCLTVTKRWGDSNMKWKTEQIRHVQDVILVIRHPNILYTSWTSHCNDLLCLKLALWNVSLCPCLPHPYHILTQARPQSAPNCQECQQHQGDQPNELWRFTKYWHNHPRHLPLWIRSHELLNYYWNAGHLSSSITNECEVGVPQVQQTLAHSSSQSWNHFPKTTKVVGFVPDASWCLIHPLRLWQNHRQCRKRWMGMCCLRKTCSFLFSSLISIKGIKHVRGKDMSEWHIVASPASNPVKHSPFFHWQVTNLDDWKSSDGLTFSISLLSMKVHGHAPQLGSARDGPKFQHGSINKNNDTANGPNPFPCRSIVPVL